MPSPLRQDSSRNEDLPAAGVYSIGFYPGSRGVLSELRARLETATPLLPRHEVFELRFAAPAVLSLALLLIGSTASLECGPEPSGSGPLVSTIAQKSSQECKNHGIH